jgi:hypothetical protein
MTNGEWVFDGTPISFDKYGNLLNGQHRLSSVIKSGKSNILRLLLVLNHRFFSTMDIGQTRTGADVLAIDGVENYKLAQTANFIYKFIRSIGESAVSDSAKHRNAGTQLSHPELIKFVSVKPLLHESVLFQMKTKNYNLPVLYQIIWCLDFIFYSLKKTKMLPMFSYEDWLLVNH